MTKDQHNEKSVITSRTLLKGLFWSRTCKTRLLLFANKADSDPPAHAQAGLSRRCLHNQYLIFLGPVSE